MNTPYRYPVMEQFDTLQGEGFHSGCAAYFIRLQGCDVGCHWCDVKDSWDFESENNAFAKDLTEEALKFNSRIAVITGGEPALHPLDELTVSLKNAGFKTHIETSGSSTLTGKWDWVTLSPKKFKDCLPDNFLLANELKVVVFHPSDLNWAEELASNVSDNCKLYLQPEWSKSEKVLPLLINYIKEHPKWRISLQTHKYLNIP